jgi:hypothetical protein
MRSSLDMQTKIFAIRPAEYYKTKNKQETL